MTSFFLTRLEPNLASSTIIKNDALNHQLPRRNSASTSHHGIGGKRKAETVGQGTEENQMIPYLTNANSLLRYRSQYRIATPRSGANIIFKHSMISFSFLHLPHQSTSLSVASTSGTADQSLTLFQPLQPNFSIYSVVTIQKKKATFKNYNHNPYSLICLPRFLVSSSHSHSNPTPIQFEAR